MTTQPDERVSEERLTQISAELSSSEKPPATVKESRAMAREIICLRSPPQDVRAQGECAACKGTGVVEPSGHWPPDAPQTVPCLACNGTGLQRQPSEAKPDVRELLNWLRELTTAVRDLNEHYWQREDDVKYAAIVAYLSSPVAEDVREVVEAVDLAVEALATRGGYIDPDKAMAAIKTLRAHLSRPAVADGWQPIETAPKGGGTEMVTDPAWVDPPEILLLFPPAKKAAAAQAVGAWDWYYAPGGNGHAGVSAWVSPASGDLLAMYYGEPTHWRPLPPPPVAAPFTPEEK